MSEPLFPDFPNEVHLHPVTYEERAEIILAVKTTIYVLPKGDDMRGQARAQLVSAAAKLEKHWCPWCPVDVRDLHANAANAVANYGHAPRERRKMGDLARTVEHYQHGLDAHFASVKEEHDERHRCICD